MREDTWHSRAACIGQRRLFFATFERAREREAKRICATCPVRTACLAEALERGEPHGVWGGLTGRERERLIAAPA